MNVNTVVAIAVFLTGTGTASAAAPAEWWAETVAAKTAGPYRVNVYGGVRLRSGEGMYQAYPGLEALRMLTGWFAAGCGFRAVWPAGGGVTELRLSGEGLLRHTIPGIVRAGMRCRFEYRQFNEGDGCWRMRTRLRLRGPRALIFGCPQASAELFTTADTPAERVRSCFGTEVSPAPRISLQLLYINEMKPGAGVRAGMHILGTVVRVQCP